VQTIFVIVTSFCDFHFNHLNEKLHTVPKQQILCICDHLTYFISLNSRKQFLSDACARHRIRAIPLQWGHCTSLRSVQAHLIRHPEVHWSHFPSPPRLLSLCDGGFPIKNRIWIRLRYTPYNSHIYQGIYNLVL